MTGDNVTWENWRIQIQIHIKYLLGSGERVLWLALQTWLVKKCYQTKIRVQMWQKKSLKKVYWNLGDFL